MTKPLQPLDPTVKRGSGLRDEDRQRLAAGLAGHQTSILRHVEESRRELLQLVDITSSVELLDLVADVFSLIDQQLKATQSWQKLLRPKLKVLTRRLAHEARLNPEDEA